VSRAVFALTVRQRLLAALLAAMGMFAVIVMVGALFPAVGDSIGKLNVPKGVSNLLGGAEYNSITGWMRSEIGAIYGPLVVGASAIAAACASAAGEEEGRILALVLAYPIERGHLLVAKAAAVVIVVVIVAAGTWLGLIIGVAVAGGGISITHVTALVLHLAFFGFALGSVALALAGTTGRKTVAAAGAAAVGVLGFLILRAARRRPRLAQVPITVLLLLGKRPAHEGPQLDWAHRPRTCHRRLHRGRRRRVPTTRPPRVTRAVASPCLSACTEQHTAPFP
jgi:ABC-type transport system involved in multi-copper enzyme maturation permease subunit